MQDSGAQLLHRETLPAPRHCLHSKTFLAMYLLNNISYDQVNLLTCVLNDSPIVLEDVGPDSLSILKDGPQCVAFGIFIIWSDMSVVEESTSSSFTMSGSPALLSTSAPPFSVVLSPPMRLTPSHPVLLYRYTMVHMIILTSNLMQGPYRHYVPNALWITINIFCISLTIIHLRRLHSHFSQLQPDSHNKVGSKKI